MAKKKEGPVAIQVGFNMPSTIQDYRGDTSLSSSSNQVSSVMDAISSVGQSAPADAQAMARDMLSSLPGLADAWKGF